MNLTNCTIVTPDTIIQNGSILIKDGRIDQVVTGPVEGLDLQGAMVLPGFIDQHIHGAFGVDFMTATPQDLERVSKQLLAHGVTGYLATTLTDDAATIHAALATLRDYQTTQPTDGAQMLGVHLEGPFVHPSYPGAQAKEHILAPDKVLLQAFQDTAGQTIRLMTYAPEWGHSLFTSFAVQLGIVPSIGHSSATLEDVDLALAEGARQITHFHNAHSPYHHRHPGVTNAGLARTVSVELIADGHHVDPAVIAATIRLKGAHRVHLITDAVPAMGEPDGVYRLGPYEVTKQAHTVRLADGTLAGSVVQFPQILSNLAQWMTLSPNELATMTSTNQASLLGLTDRGRIEAGARADFAVVNEGMEVIATFVNGERVWPT